MKRIAIIEDGYVRDTQIFTENPSIITEDSEDDWANHFSDVKYPCLYIGIFEGVDEDEIKKIAAESKGVHPDIIFLVDFGQMLELATDDSETISEFDLLRHHVGHKIKTVIYGGDRNVAIECLDCCEVLYSINNPKYKEDY